MVSSNGQSFLKSSLRAYNSDLPPLLFLLRVPESLRARLLRSDLALLASWPNQNDFVRLEAKGIIVGVSKQVFDNADSDHGTEMLRY